MTATTPARRDQDFMEALHRLSAVVQCVRVPVAPGEPEIEARHQELLTAAAAAIDRVESHGPPKAELLDLVAALEVRLERLLELEATRAANGAGPNTERMAAASQRSDLERRLQRLRCRG